MLGFLSGLFGVGGSSIATPLLRLLDVSRLVALATPLPVTLPTALVGGVTYWRRGLVDGRVVFWTAVGGIPAVILGAYLTTVVPGRLLMLLTGLFVVAVGIRLLHKPLAFEGRQTRPAAASGLLTTVGAGVGLLSGFLANGGGFLLVPAYLILFHLEAREAAATSLVAVALLALPGTLVHWWLGHVDPSLAVLLAIGCVPSAYLGARTGMALQGRQARVLFGLFLLTFGLFFLLRTLYRAEVYGWLS
ncbi:MAG: sulfite exporter TauE/SafE family protein [Candidatus Latescibacteria bacterium]|nr:sulfite exporter TauE/SafE family protein [Candidatus Latescibacterota bacterium]